MWFKWVINQRFWYYTVCKLYFISEWVFLYFNCFSTALIIEFPISKPVADSIPSKPSEELTSKSKGPLFERIISTPATGRFKILAAFIANFLSTEVILTYYYFEIQKFLNCS